MHCSTDLMRAQTIFELTPLNFAEWLAVFKMAFPVIILDEILKFMARSFAEGAHTRTVLYSIPV